MNYGHIMTAKLAKAALSWPADSELIYAKEEKSPGTRKPMIHFGGNAAVQADRCIGTREVEEKEQRSLRGFR